MLDKPIHERYINSIYWGAVTMNTVGYGDIFPCTITERLCSIFFLWIACLVFTFTFNKIGAAF